MWNELANHKKIALNFIFILVIIFAFVFAFDGSIFKSFAQTENSELETELSDNISNILDDIDSNELDDYLPSDISLDFFNVSTFKVLVTKILNGTYFDEYDSLFAFVKDLFFSEIQSVLKVFVSLFVIVVLYVLFKNFCTDKYAEFKNSVKIIFSLILVLVLCSMFKIIAGNIIETINTLFNFSKILFPILLSLVLLAGAGGTHAVYSSLSLFLLNTGSYLFVYVLIPISVSILLLSLFGSIFDSKRFSKIIEIFKSIFKYVVGIFFGVFGLISAVNLISSGVKDGVSLKLTKFAIKNYVPIVGGYISEGFDFVHTCSVLVKNAFGVCGILILFFIVLKPLILYFAYLLLFKILSAVVSLLGVNEYSEVFDNVSKSISYFISVLVLVFLILFVFIYLLIVSVSVVWCDL